LNRETSFPSQNASLLFHLRNRDTLWIEGEDGAQPADLMAADAEATTSVLEIAASSIRAMVSSYAP
jgi:hypothetical protein